MGVLDELALSGVDKVERSLGPRAALRALVPMLDTLPAGRGRARGLLRAIGYAAELGDDAALESLCARWSVDGVGREARALLRRLLAAERFDAAVRLARAEVDRVEGPHDEAPARYALGRCLEAAGRLPEALSAYADAERLASGRSEAERRHADSPEARSAGGPRRAVGQRSDQRDQPRLRQSAAARGVRVLLALGRRDEAAYRAGRLLPLERAAPEERLAVAVAALEAPGRYRRAAALDALEQLARGGGSAGREAARFAAWHAERSGSALSEIEADRIQAALGPEERRAVEALLAGGAAPCPLLVRAKAVAEGYAAGPRIEGSDRETVGWLGLAACAALRSKNRVEAREHLRELVERIGAGARVEAPVWTAAWLALSDARLSDPGRELAAALLDRDGEPPPRGYAGLAEILDAARAPELATEAWRRAAARREPGARERLAVLVRWRGWQAAQAGDRDRAIALLEEARRLAGAE